MIKNCMQSLLSLSFLLFVGVMLSSCASDGGFMSGGDYATYAREAGNHTKAEASRISAQSKAIADAAASTQTTTPTESAMLAIIAMMQIERLAPTPHGLARPTTGYDVLDKLVGQVPILATVGGMYSLGKISIENAGQVTVGQGATLENSLNHTTTSALGTSNTVTATGSTPAQVVEPMIVEVPTP